MENTYPKTVKLENENLKKLLKEKAALIIIGRAKSVEVEEIEKKMNEVDKQLQAEEAKVNLTSFKEREKEITARMEACIADINKVKEEIYAKIKTETPQELRDKYDGLKKHLSDKEIERNKVALKVQKYNDKIIPIGRNLMKEHLENEYDDYDTLQLVDDKIVCTVFNHLEDWKDNFTKRKK